MHSAQFITVTFDRGEAALVAIALRHASGTIAGGRWPEEWEVLASRIILAVNTADSAAAKAKPED